MEVERPRVPVKGEKLVEVELKFPRHGPTVHENPRRNMAFAVRAAWLEPGIAFYLGSMDYMCAEDWDGFLDAGELPVELIRPGDGSPQPIG